MNQRRDSDREDFKAAVKEAVNEWLEDKFATFGKWTFRGIVAAMFGATVIFLVRSGRWP